MRITLQPPRRWGIALLMAAVACGSAALTPAHAQSIPAVPVIVLPVAPVELSVPIILPPNTVRNSGGSRGGVIWSTSGRADVDIAIDEHHGRAVAP